MSNIMLLCTVLKLVLTFRRPLVLFISHVNIRGQYIYRYRYTYITYININRRRVVIQTKVDRNKRKKKK